MSITLEQVDQLRERTGVSYQKAKELLEQTNGDVLEAIVLLEGEKEGKEKFSHSAQDFGNEVIKTLKDLLNQGKVNRIVVEKDDKTVMNIPVAVGALGALFLTSATTVGLIAALATGCIIKIHKEDGEIINVNDKAAEVFKRTKEKAEEVFEATKQHVQDPHVVREEEAEKDVTVEVTEEEDKIVVEVKED
jgi:N-acetylmuramic acid 6-phosphate (MurNAc-6-P) etherase